MNHPLALKIEDISENYSLKEKKRLVNMRNQALFPWIESWEESKIELEFSKGEKMDDSKEKYEYETIQIVPGGIVWNSELNSLGEQGYRLVGVVPLTQVLYNGVVPAQTSNGTNLIFERRKETE